VLKAVEEAARTRNAQPVYSETAPGAIEFVAIPVLRRGNVHEIMYVRFAKPRRLDERLLNRIDLLAVQAASHLENAALNEAIRASNDRMRTILDSTRDSIILLDRNGHLQDANAATADLLGLDLQHHTGKPFDEVIYWLTDNETLREIADTYTTDPDSLNECEYQLMLSAESDTVTYLKTLVSAVRDAESNRVIGRLLILRDITEEKSLEEFRQKFQSMIIHDLRGPLGGIISAMHLANMIIETDFPDNKSGETLNATLEVSLESASNLLNLVDTLHNLPTIDRMSIEPERADLLNIVEQAYNSLSMSLREADIDVRYHIPEDVQELFVDENLIRRVFINLLQNAFKFTPEDGQIQIAVDEADDDFLRVRISDTGPGIPEDMRDAIFQQGMQIEGRKPRAGGKGSGLGLNFCKLAVEAHGGYIRVEPEGPLSGACFVFTLPVYHPSSGTDSTNGRSAAD
jgi:PAS domain S-box-containing protein